MFQQLYKISFILVCFVLIDSVGLAAEGSRAEQMGEKFIDFSVEITSEVVQPGEAIEVTLTYCNTNKWGVPVELPGAFQIGKKRSGLVAVVQDEKGRAIGTTGKERGPLRNIRLRPNATETDQVRLPQELTPNTPGTYSLTVTYHKGYVVLGQGYKRKLEATSNPINFEVKKKAKNKNEPKSAIDATDYEAWKQRLKAASKQQVEKLLDDTASMPVARSLLAQALVDAALPLAVRLEAAERLKHKEFPYNPDIVDLVQSGDEESEITIAAIEVLPYMKQTDAEDILRSQLQAVEQTTNLRYRLALVSTLTRSASLTVQELKALAKKHQDPRVQLLVVPRLLSKGELKAYKAAEGIAEKLTNDQTPIEEEDLGRYLEEAIESDRVVGEVAQKYLGLIDVLKEELAK